MDDQARRDAAAEKLTDLRLLLSAMSTLGENGAKTVNATVRDLRADLAAAAAAEPALPPAEQARRNCQRHAARLLSLGAHAKN